MGKFMNLLIVLVAIVFISTKSPYVEPVAYRSTLPEKLDGPLTPNTKLDATERLHENKIHWPEAFAVHKGQIYTGLGDGRIVRIDQDKVTEICRTGDQCEGQHEEHICGRPLGMTFSKSGILYVVDGYLGLFTVDVKTGAKKNLVPGSKVLDDLPLTFMNDLSFDEKEEALYISQSSTKWNISHVLLGFLEHEESGRLLKYNLKTNQISVLLKSLPFPNGVELDHSGSALLVANSISNSLFKYHISGAKLGKVEQLPTILPGEPDNISRNPRGNYWIGLATAHSKESPSLLEHVSEMPLVRKIFLNVHRVLATPISKLLSIMPQKMAKEIGLEIKSLRFAADVIPSPGCIVEIDSNGKILQSLHSPSGKVKHISQVQEYNGYLYLGSWRNHYLGRLKL